MHAEDKFRQYADYTDHHLMIAIMSRALFINNILGDGLILDIGCGEGKLYPFIRKKTRYIIGVDFSIFHLRFAYKKPVILADAANLPFRKSVFDCIIAGEILEHVPNQAKALTEWSRCLKQSKQIILTVPNGERLSIWSRKRERNTSVRIGDEMIFHRDFTRIELEDLLFSQGFKITDTMTINFHTPLNFLYWIPLIFWRRIGPSIDRLLAHAPFFRFKGEHLLFVAMKK